MKQEVWWMQTLMKVASYGLLYFIKHKNDMYICACNTPEAGYKLFDF